MRGRLPPLAALQQGCSTPAQVSRHYRALLKAYRSGGISFAANRYGLHDMLGNVSQWTRSLWEAIDDGAANLYPPLGGQQRFEALHAGNAVRRLVRGGAWYGSHYFARCAFRDYDYPDDPNLGLGFRVVLRSSSVE